MRRARHIENKIDNLYESVGVSMEEINRILIRIDEGAFTLDEVERHSLKFSLRVISCNLANIEDNADDIWSSLGEY